MNKDHSRDVRPERDDPGGINYRLVIGLRDISHTMRSLYEGKGSQRRILIVLSQTGTITQRELTQRLGIQPGSASEVIAKLENAGLVERVASETDRRTADISLTEEGERQAAEAVERRLQRHQEMFSVLSEEEKLQFLALLDKINSHWADHYAGRQEHHCAEHRSSGRRRHEYELSGHHKHYDGHSSHENREHEQGEGRGCDHDCENCAHPCGRGRQ